MHSCVSVNSSYIGTTGARYGINPYPDNLLWLEYLNKISTNTDRKVGKSILWNVGSYSKNGMQLNFPGIDDSDYKFSTLDYNEHYLSFFDKNKIKVFLTIEPSNLELYSVLNTIIETYSKHKSVVGICIDLEWIENDSLIDSELIEYWLSLIKIYDKNYKLIIKHWNYKNIIPYNDENLIYLQSMEGVSSLDELNKRVKVWDRYFYPNNIGIEVGFKKDTFWINLENPINTLYSSIKDISSNKCSFFWSESSLYYLFQEL